MSEKIILSKPTEYEVRGGVTIKVYPASLETLSQLDPKLKDLEKVMDESNLAAQINIFIDVVYELVREDNDIKKEDLKKVLTVEAALKIIQSAVGTLNSLS
jgi:radical SAM superfamily enzyme YgiQ (UPF0313 family)